MNPLLKQELQQQRTTIFGNRRYWFHVAIWALVAIVGLPGVRDMSNGMSKGITVIDNDSAKNSVIAAGNSMTQVGQNIMGDTILLNSKDSVRTKGSLKILQASGKALSRGNKQIKLSDSGFYKSIFTAGLMAAVMVYFFLLFAIPYARYRQQKRMIIGSILINLLFYAATLTVMGIVISKMSDPHLSKRVLFVTNFLPVLLIAIMSLLIIGTFFAIYYFIDLYDQQKALNRYQQVFTDKVYAETNFLKMQINPHFLFNTLNNIYSLTLTQSDDASIITRRLKELVQYMLNDCTKETVPLTGELEFLSNYVALEKLRNKQENVDIDLSIKSDATDMEIAPLLLVNFIENAFKHGVKAGIEHSFVKINIYVLDKLLSMEVTNSKPGNAGDKKLAIKEVGGIGIKNVKRRLEILYPKRYKLRINETSGLFAVHLNIQL